MIRTDSTAPGYISRKKIDLSRQKVPKAITQRISDDM